MSDKKLHEYLSNFVTIKGMSKRKFAIEAGIKPAQFNRYVKSPEQGGTEPTLAILRRIQERFPDFKYPMVNTSEGPKVSSSSEAEEVAMAIVKFVKKVYETGDNKEKEIEGVKDMVITQRDNFMQVIARVHKQHDDLQKDVVDLSRDHKELTRKVEQLLTVHNQKTT